MNGPLSGLVGGLAASPNDYARQQAAYEYQRMIEAQLSGSVNKAQSAGAAPSPNPVLLLLPR